MEIKRSPTFNKSDFDWPFFMVAIGCDDAISASLTNEQRLGEKSTCLKCQIHMSNTSYIHIPTDGHG